MLRPGFQTSCNLHLCEACRWLWYQITGMQIGEKVTNRWSNRFWLSLAAGAKSVLPGIPELLLIPGNFKQKLGAAAILEVLPRNLQVMPVCAVTFVGRLQCLMRCRHTWFSMKVVRSRLPVPPYTTSWLHMCSSLPLIPPPLQSLADPEIRTPYRVIELLFKEVPLRHPAGMLSNVQVLDRIRKRNFQPPAFLF